MITVADVFDSRYIYNAGIPTTYKGVAVAYRGLSTDAKPTLDVFNGSSFYEMDTSKIYMFDATDGQWIEQTIG